MVVVLKSEAQKRASGGIAGYPSSCVASVSRRRIGREDLSHGDGHVCVCTENNTGREESSRLHPDGYAANLVVGCVIRIAPDHTQLLRCPLLYSFSLQ